MEHYKIYNNLKLFCLIGIVSLFTFTCDNRDEEPLEENIEMWVNVNKDTIPTKQNNFKLLYIL